MTKEKKKKGCLTWLLYGFIAMIVLGACGALLSDGEEEQSVAEQPKEEKPKEEKKEETKEEEKEETKEEEQSKTIESIANSKLGNVIDTDEYDGELTVTFEADYTSNDKRMLTLLTDDMSRFLLDVRDNAEDLNNYNTLVVVAEHEGAPLYSVRITNEQFNNLPENDLDGQIELQYNMENYVDSVFMRPQYRDVKL